MAHYHTLFLIILLIISGLIGWSLLALVLTQNHYSKKNQLWLIGEINKDLQKVKEDLKNKISH